MVSVLDRLGFKELIIKDQSLSSEIFLQKVINNLKMNGLPKLGLNLLMGPEIIEKLTNLRNGILNGNIEFQSGIYIKY